ncbi:MAG: hypothetical protein C0412_16715 [Flavobacterium sp.]|nr:hypothetical protein [Flavobacterium sp.]
MRTKLIKISLITLVFLGLFLPNFPLNFASNKIQSEEEVKETTFISEDTILDHNITGSVEITADNITLDCNNYKIEGSGTGMGILMIDRKGVTIKNCEVNNFAGGIVLMSFLIPMGSDNLLFQNTIKDNERGIVLYSTSNESIIENNISSNGYGVFLSESSNNTVSKNNISGNITGISSIFSSNTFTSNNISNNEIGIVFEECPYDNKVYHNNFINNLSQVSIEFEVTEDFIFDNSYPSGGNYWSDYDTPEEGCVDENNNDFCDTPYTFYGGQDRYSFIKENGWEAPPEPEKWSFAVLTDLHIGFDIPDYDGYSYNDVSPGQDYYLSKRLEAIINRINELKNDYNLKFVTVLGDISDTAEYSELVKARDILNKLNDPNNDGNLEDGIPYIPIIGNHDVWPYTQKEGIDPDIRGEENWATIADSAIGDEYFEGIFWNENSANTLKIQNLFGEFTRQENKDFPYLQNYVFSYKGVGFISLDYIETARKEKPGYSWIKAIKFQSQPITTTWLDYNLKKFEDNPIILFSHDPYFFENLFEKLSEKYFFFAGHIHDRKCNDNITDVSDIWCEWMAKFRLGAIPTEALREEYKEKSEENTGVIRIVQIKDVEKPTKEDIDYSTIRGIPEEIATDDIKRPDPYIFYSPESPAPNEEITFIARDEIREKDIKSCKWDFGDGFTDNSGKCEVKHSYSPFILWKYTAKATITYLDDTQRIAEKSLWVLPKFKLKVPESIIPNLLIDETINVVETPQNTPASVSLFKEIGAQKIPIGIINVHFEKAGEK